CWVLPSVTSETGSQVSTVTPKVPLLIFLTNDKISNPFSPCGPWIPFSPFIPDKDTNVTAMEIVLCVPAEFLELVQKI
uniref:Uncharacterized protein n=1 Tax=Scleropages formosus TaxID=113540 RepID=A0A8C9RZT5_SCLFO